LKKKQVTNKRAKKNKTKHLEVIKKTKGKCTQNKKLACTFKLLLTPGFKKQIEYQTKWFSCSRTKK